MITTPRAKLLSLLMAATVAFAAALFPAPARAAGDTDTLERQIDQFVSNAVVTSTDESLARWDTPICPLVAGLPKDQGEFILARVSAIARASHVPLGAEHCGPNFYVVVTNHPDTLVKKWWDSDRTRARGPVRVFYNAEFRTSAGAKPSGTTAGLDLTGGALKFVPPPSAAQGLTSVIMVVDSQRTMDIDINIGQLADYVAMVGLAQLRPDADVGMVPTILRLFRQTNQPPPGLTAWDESFLRTLYATDHSGVVQVSAIKEGMLVQIAR